MNTMAQNFPFVSVCTPTFNRRPFFPNIIKCFLMQDYPADRIEWIIIDDGTDKICDLVESIPQVKYFAYPEKMYLGKKRNVMHEKSKGDIIIYMDDDDYYPPERISHAVETLQKNPSALCAGSSEMYIYFKHIQKMYQFGPYGPNHSTAATFAFRRELLNYTSYDDNACIAEEKKFLKDYTIPFVQLNPFKTILVFSHIHNSYDKKDMLESLNQHVKLSTKTVDDFVEDSTVKQFFMHDIDDILNNYEPGKPMYKPDVLEQMKQLMQTRKNKLEQQNQHMQSTEKKLYDQTILVHKLATENTMLKEKVKYLEDKINHIISQSIQLKKESRINV
jgi:glycosyltransferase involved in cell wall biosynthesis